MPSIDELKENNRVNMAQPQVKDKHAKGAQSGRVIADLSSLPKPESSVEIKNSPIDDIVKEGGVLDKYIEEKTQEMIEYFEEKEAEAELEETAQEIDDGINIDMTNPQHQKQEAIPSTDLEDEDVINIDMTQDTTEYNEIKIDVNNDQSIDQELDDDDESIDENDQYEEDIIEEETISDDEDLEEDENDIDEIEDIDIDVKQEDPEDEESIDTDEDDQVEKETDSEVVDRSPDEILEELKAAATDKLKPVSKKLDLSSFTIIKKPSKTVKLPKSISSVAKWVLPSAKSIVGMREFTGAELEQLRESTDNSVTVAGVSRRFRIIYDHITTPKPVSFEAWCKSTSYTDVDHLFFAIYIASFNQTNFIPGDCTNDKCKTTFLSDNIPIMDMVKFEDVNSKTLFNDIYNTDKISSNNEGMYISEVIPLSGQIAVAFKDPSIYNIIESIALSGDEKFMRNHTMIANIMPYIDALYRIDQENQTLSPIPYKVYPDDAIKTVKSKAHVYAKVIGTLSVDEFTPLNSMVSEMTKRSSDIKMSYRIPVLKCPKCGHEEEEKTISAEELVFTRFQLGALVNTSLN